MFSQRRSHYWSQQSRTNGTTCCIVALLHNSVCCCFVTTWRLKFIAAFFFFKGFSAKQQKKPKKKEIITTLQSECIMRQLYGKYYKMFASKNDRSKWRARREVDRSSPRSGRHCPLTGRYFEPCTSLTESKIYNNRLSEAKIRKLHILVKC